MIVATLVGGGSPPLVQIVVSTSPDGEPWTITGAAGDYVWVVPGGMGVGDGGQVTLVDNRSPGNVPVVYTFTSASVVESSAGLVVPFTADVVFQSLDGQRTVQVNLEGDEFATSYEPNQAAFTIPGRRRSVVRYSPTMDAVGEFSFSAAMTDTPAIEALLETGEPLIYRCGARIADLLRVGVFRYTNVSTTGIPVTGWRWWRIPYALIDDPFMDQRLGAFSWDDFEEAMAGRDWDEFDTLMSGLSWDQFDTFDWSTL